MIKKLWLLLSLLAPVAYAQSWVTVVPAESQSTTISVTLPVGAQYRFLSTNGNATSTLIATTAPISDFDNGMDGNPPDPSPNFQKSFQVAASQSSFNAIVTDTSTSPATVTSIPVAATSFPPFSFVVGAKYNVSVSNIPPVTPNDPLRGLIKVYYGNIVVWSAICSYQTTLTSTDTPPSLSALFGCVTLPVPPGQPLPINPSQ